MSKLDIRMLVKVERPYYGGDYIGVNAYPVYLTEQRYESEPVTDGYVIRYFDGSWGSPKRGLWKMSLHGQADLRTDDPIYGWDNAGAVHWQDIHEVGLVQLNEMVKMARLIDRRLEVMRTTLGYPKTYSDQLIRVAKIVIGTNSPFGGSLFGFDHGNSLWPSGECYRWVGPDMLESMVETKLRQLRESVRGVLAA
jgi:hypothetical protein